MRQDGGYGYEEDLLMDEKETRTGYAMNDGGLPRALEYAPNLRRCLLNARDRRVNVCFDLFNGVDRENNWEFVE